MPNTITRYSPRDVVPTRSIIDQLLESSFFSPSLMDRWANAVPNIPANLVETQDSYVVEVALPGLNAEKLEIKSVNRELRVQGLYEERKLESGNYLWNGLPQGEFTQTFTLPAEVANDQAEASYTNGVLVITLPKAEHAKIKTIPVKTTV